MTRVDESVSLARFRVIAAVACMIIACLPVAAQNGPAAIAATTPEPYDALTTRLRTGETNIDYRALRQAYAARKDADGAGSDQAVRRTMNIALTEKRYQDTIKIAEVILTTVYISPDTHAALSRAYTELGDPKKAAQHKAIYLGLINSVLAEGNGETPQKAYTVVTLEEVFAVMRALNLSVWGRANEVQNGKWYEVLSATDQRTDNIVRIYFNIDVPRSIQARTTIPKP